MFHIHAVVGEVHILVFLLDIDKVLVIVNIVGVRIGLSSGLFLLLTLDLHKQESMPPNRPSTRTPTRGCIFCSSISTEAGSTTSGVGSVTEGTGSVTSVLSV